MCVMCRLTRAYKSGKSGCNWAAVLSSSQLSPNKTPHIREGEKLLFPQSSTVWGKNTWLIYLVVRAFHGSSMNVYRTILHESASSASRKLFFSSTKKNRKANLMLRPVAIFILVVRVAARSLNRNPCVLPRPGLSVHSLGVR